ncbi:hypothetical protein [Paenibacillus sp. FSL K6-0108]|uniref:hypothetical protein n=1 Tax=Paenibacillus sp. FSL K6-0108 TaxID=2921417 RepID=UPI00324FC70D
MGRVNSNLPVYYKDFFGSGTRPTEWRENAPEWDFLVAQLREQPDRIHDLFNNKLGVSVEGNFLKAESVGDLILSSVMHEISHVGTVSAMLKLLHS